MLIVHAFEHQALPFEEVAGLEGIQGVQLVNLCPARNLELQGISAFQVHIEIAAEHAATQFQADERADIGLGDPQVDVLGIHFQLGADRVEVDLAGRLNLALLAQARVDFQREWALVEAIEVLHIDVQRADFQRDRRLGLTVSQVHLIVAQLHVLEQHLPRLAWRDGFSFWRAGGGGCILGSDAESGLLGWLANSFCQSNCPSASSAAQVSSLLLRICQR